MFIDVHKCAIYYVDSVGEEPLKEFKKFMNKVKKQGDDLLYNNTININNINDSYSILLDTNKISKDIISVSNPKLLKINNIVNLSKTKNNLDSKNNNKIKNINGNYILLDKNCNSCKYLIQKSFRIFYSDLQHQQKDSECGIYSINFIDNMLNDIDFYDYVKKIKTDEEMNKLRFNKYFIPFDSIFN